MQDIKPNQCPACVFGPWEITFGAHKGSTVAKVPQDYQRWLCANGYAYVVLQELWHHGDHKPEEHPDAVFKKLTSAK